MPLPDAWHGIFYGKESGGELLFDLDPQEFIQFIKEDTPNSPQFLIARAYFDLIINDHAERAQALLTAARERWPDSPWGTLVEIAQQGKLALPNENKDVSSLFAILIHKGFGGMMILDATPFRDQRN